MTVLEKAYEMVAGGAPHAALLLIGGTDRKSRAGAIAALRLASMFDEADWKVVRQMLEDESLRSAERK